MSQSRIEKFSVKTFQLLSSLKLAVLVILSLAIALATATIIESLYDTPTAQYWVYRSIAFHLLLAALGLNIFCVAMSRFPWKKHHTPFLLAHLGILILLAGSWITERAGIDGNLRVSEGETASVVELDTSALVLSDSTRAYSIPIQWLPPNVEFKAFNTSASRVPYELIVDQFLSHADPVVSFIPNGNRDLNQGKLATPKLAAARLKIEGGPMGISQDFWLWEGAPGWKSLQMGPAHFTIGSEVESGSSLKVTSGQSQSRMPIQPRFRIDSDKAENLIYEAYSSSGKKVVGQIPKSKVQGFSIQPGWKGNVKIRVEEWIPDAVASTTYKPARIQYGNQAPTSAIHVVASSSSDVWLGLGDRAVLHVGDREVAIGYFPKRLVLPFSVRLDRFTVEHDQGTLTPAAYSSRVTVLDGKDPKEAVISMNEPLQMNGYTLYQASYEEGDPRPTISIFSVNRDPGRPWKYFGSLLIVCGSILLFAKKYKLARKSKQNSSRVSQLEVTSPSEAL